jgi:hypothetical protein
LCRPDPRGHDRSTPCPNWLPASSYICSPIDKKSWPHGAGPSLLAAGRARCQRFLPHAAMGDASPQISLSPDGAIQPCHGCVSPSISVVASPGHLCAPLHATSQWGRQLNTSCTLQVGGGGRRSSSRCRSRWRHAAREVDVGHARP